jgi:hypothetical protein
MSYIVTEEIVPWNDCVLCFPGILNSVLPTLVKFVLNYATLTFRFLEINTDEKFLLQVLCDVITKGQDVSSIALSVLNKYNTNFTEFTELGTFRYLELVLTVY